MSKVDEANRFKFGIDFQELILKTIITDKQGFRMLEFLEDSYFVITQHQIILYAIKQYYKKNKKIPEEPYLRESLRVLYQREKFSELLTKEDIKDISDRVKNLYIGIVSNPDEIIHKCIDFSRYVKFKEELNNVDIDDFDSYEQAIDKLKSANNIGLDIEKNYGVFIVRGIRDRIYKRQSTQVINPTPFKQINSLLNSGGLQRGSVICFMGKEKRFKTGMLINTGVGYMRMRKKVFYVDLENGEIAISTRIEQSISHQTQEVINSESWEEPLLKTMRKYNRLGAELVIKRFPALNTDCNDISNWLDQVEELLGFKFDIGIIDYGPLLASVSNQAKEFDRISDAFLDIKNLAETRKLEAIYTAAHVTRDGDKHTGSKYESTDIAKCIDIPRHIDALLGLQENKEEQEAGVLRIEVVEQRNGMRDGNALFWLDIAKQRIREFSKSEIKAYRSQLGEYERPKREDRKTDL